MESSKAPVVVIVAIILMGAIIWGVWAIRMASDIDPERAKTLAEEAERECVLRGFDPERCPKLVGRHHRDCLQQTQKESDTSLLDESIYLDCMTKAFGSPESDPPDAPDAETPDAGASDTGGANTDATTAGDSGSQGD